jgi:hypothetical protein
MKKRLLSTFIGYVFIGVSTSFEYWKMKSGSPDSGFCGGYVQQFWFLPDILLRMVLWIHQAYMLQLTNKTCHKLCCQCHVKENVKNRQKQHKSTDTIYYCYYFPPCLPFAHLRYNCNKRKTMYITCLAGYEHTYTHTYIYIYTYRSMHMHGHISWITYP